VESAHAGRASIGDRRTSRDRVLVRPGALGDGFGICCWIENPVPAVFFGLRTLDDEQRKRLERRYREERAQTPKGSCRWRRLNSIILWLSVGEPLRDIHKLHRGCNKRKKKPGPEKFG